jgi:hypothetical protein
MAATTPPPNTSVPFPVLGDNGFVLPDESAILVGRQADINGAFGNRLNFTTTSGSLTNSTPQASLAASDTAVIGDNFAVFAWLINNVDPAYASGRMQDAIGRLYFIARQPARATIQPCVCNGLPEVVIPVGTLAKDPNGVLWIAQTAGTIENTGNVTVNFACVNAGPVAAPISLEPYQSIFGWDTIAPDGAAVLGVDEESPAQFEIRRSLSTGLNSMGPLNAIYAAVAALDDVLDVYVIENTATFSATIGGVLIGPNSIYVCVLGGSQLEIANAIFSRKSPGAGMTGNTITVIADPNPLYIAPIPQYTITYQTPTIVSFYVAVSVTNSNAVPASAQDQVQNAVVDAFAGLDGGPRGKIGSMIYASRYYSPVASLSAVVNAATGLVTPGWSAAIVSIKLGRKTAAGTFTGSIASNTLTVSSGGPGISVGDVLTGTGVRTGTMISARLSGTGSTGTYILNGTQTAGSQTMARFTMGDDVQLNIDEAPAVSAADVFLTLV